MSAKTSTKYYSLVLHRWQAIKQTNFVLFSETRPFITLFLAKRHLFVVFLRFSSPIVFPTRFKRDTRQVGHVARRQHGVIYSPWHSMPHRGRNPFATGVVRGHWR